MKMKKTKRLKAWWAKLSPNQRRGMYFLLMIAAIAVAFEMAMYRLPLYIPDTAISQIVTVYILVNVGLLVAVSHVQQQETRTLTLGLNLLGLVVSLFTFVSATIQTGFKVLSTDYVTWDFQIATGLLLWTIEGYTAGLLLGKSPKRVSRRNPRKMIQPYGWKQFN